MGFAIGISKFQILSYIFVTFFLLGLLNIHFSDREENCLMTYMFEYPQFVPIPVAENEIYPQYGLYAYSEGRLTEKVRKMWFDGIPVLFLPGNAGSYKQARSLASVALQKAMNKAFYHDSHFDYFTVNYNSELSGLYGGVLYRQTNFTAACISKILSLYKMNKYQKAVPKTVILIGHSMGGVIAKRLLAFPYTLNTTSIAITLSSPLEAPPLNTDLAMDSYYMSIESEWKENVRNKPAMKGKILLSFGGGARDVLVPSGLTSSNDSFISALTTAVPGVWVSTDHVSIVWCKQLVLTLNRYLFDIVDPATEQISGNKQLLRSKALQYFQANRSSTYDPKIRRPVKPMLVDAFWYEDSRRKYQIARPEIQKTTYLMIRLVNTFNNRFAAVESVNVEDKDWIFGCNAKFTRNHYRYCEEATSLTEFSRWTGVANPKAGKKKLATIPLAEIGKNHLDWSHVIVKVSPTFKPITLNVDIFDYENRLITVHLRYLLLFWKQTILSETLPDSFYYELEIPGFDTVHESYLLYVEPTKTCNNTQYHVSAELHVPWANNHEYYHYFTHLKRSPMKLTLSKTNPNVTYGLTPTEFVKVILLVDPLCTFKISISSSWYHRLAQFVRHYSPAVIPYCAAIILLATRSNIVHLMKHGSCVSLHTSLTSGGVRPYYVLVYARLCVVLTTSVPILSCFCETIRNNLEMQYFVRSILVVPTYMIALGMVNILAATILAVMVFSSQIAHRLLFRIMWRGGSSLAEKVAGVLQKVPTVVSVTLMCAAQLSCGAAALAAGAAFYGFMISKMYEEYLEDYFYKLLAKMSARTWQFILSKRKKSAQAKKEEHSIFPVATASETEKQSDNTKSIDNKDDEIKPNEPLLLENKVENSSNVDNNGEDNDSKIKDNTAVNVEIDEDLSNLNFHMMMFMLWLAVTLVNFPALLIWARNFKHSMFLEPDESYFPGIILSACSCIIWQRNGPRTNLKCYPITAAILFSMATLLLVLGPFSLGVVNYVITSMFLMITLQQLFDCEEQLKVIHKSDNNGDDTGESKPSDNENSENVTNSEKGHAENESSSNDKEKASSDKNVDNVGEPHMSSSSNQNKSDPKGSTKDDSERINSEKGHAENKSSSSDNEKESSDKNLDSVGEPNVSGSSNQNNSDPKDSTKDDSERIKRKHSFIADDFGAI